MYNMPPDPMYSMAPVMPPGWYGVPYMLGPLVADLTGGVARPYVPPNMATYDATMAAQVNNPLYKAMLANMYGQFGAQIGHTAGAMGFVQSLGTMAGYSPAETQRALSGGMGAFARSQMGSFVMPFVNDSLNAMGLTGGSFVAMTQAAFNARMNLMGPGALINPYNAGQQHQAMGAASAMASMLNGIMTQRDAGGNLLLATDQRVTQGFSREAVTQLAMEAAGMGMFTTRAPGAFGHLNSGTGGLFDKLSRAVGPNVNLGSLRAVDFEDNGASRLGDEAVQAASRLKDEVQSNVQALTEALGAMRDLTGKVGDELKQLLNSSTNGGWMRSRQGALAARDALRTLHAASKAYNINPNAALEQIAVNRVMLQDAAGFDGSMLSLGFNGGGLFGLSAQVELLTGVEDMINARGIRGDPILSARLRGQALQAMARNENSTAGKGAQILAYARQLGIISEKEAGGFSDLLTSGDSAQMGEGLNRLLTTVFGSSEAGRRFMADSMQMNSMRMALNDDAGAFATALTMRGAFAEFGRREEMTAASRRLDFTKQVLAESGLNTWQSAEGAGKVVSHVVAAIRGNGQDQGRNAAAAAFQERYDAMVARGMDPRTAANAVVSAFRRNPVTAQYAQEIDLAVKRQSAANNEELIKNGGGLESRQATDLLQALVADGNIGGRESAELYRMVRDGRGAEALSRIDSLVSGLSPSQRTLYAKLRADAAERHRAAIATMEDNSEATSLVGMAVGKGYSGEDVAKAYETLAAAGLQYVRDKGNDGASERFWETISQTRFADIFGDKAWEQYMAAARGHAVDPATGKPITPEEYFKVMGRRAGALRRAAIDALGSSGYGLQLSGYWGGGLSTINSLAARQARDATISGISGALQKDALLQAADRDPLATRMADFFMGRRNWKNIISVYDPDDERIGGKLAKYGAAFDEYQKAQRGFDDLQGGYDDALKYLYGLGTEEGDATLEYVKHLFDSGGMIRTDMLGARLEDDGSGLRGKEGEKARAAIMAAARARNAVLEAQRTAEDVMKEAAAQDGFGNEAKELLDFADIYDKRHAKLADDLGVASFIKDFDFTEEGMDAATGKSKAFLKALFANVTDEEVAAEAKVGVSEDLRMLRPEAAWAVAQRKAREGKAEGLEVVRAARAASREGSTRIYGELTIRSGNDSSPAALEGHLGNLGGM